MGTIYNYWEIELILMTCDIMRLMVGFKRVEACYGSCGNLASFYIRKDISPKIYKMKPKSINIESST